MLRNKLLRCVTIHRVTHHANIISLMQMLCQNDTFQQRFPFIHNTRKYSGKTGKERPTHRQIAPTLKQKSPVRKPREIKKVIPLKSRTETDIFAPVDVDISSQNTSQENVGEELAGKLSSGDKSKILRQFMLHATVKQLAAEHGLKDQMFDKAIQSFRKYCMSLECLPVELHIMMCDFNKGAGHVTDIFPFFLGHAKLVYPHLECMEDLQKISNLTEPPNWYPLARAMQRKIIFHAGPTNSGKTFHALKHFMESKSGIYCGPLRLLALEVYDKANKQGVPCDLITGESRRYANEDKSPADHSACTVEMMNINKEYDVAVIDEIQMIGDIQRGWSWTRAFLGVAAKEVHVCGEETAIDLLQKLTNTTGDLFEVQQYKRLTTLSYLQKAVGGFGNIQPGDCIVCFSKSDIFKIQQKLYSIGHKCAVIYGGLPPGVKIMMSQRFNDPNNECNVLVATDAIGMGLNLAIKRIIFYSLIKPAWNEDGNMSMELLSTSQAQQIAGRAGRYRTQYEDGEVTTFNQKDLEILHTIVNAEKPPIQKAGLNPTVEQIEMFSYHLPKATLSDLLDIFVYVSQLDDLYFMCNLEQFKELSKLIEHIPLRLATRFSLCAAPLKVRRGFASVMFVRIAKQMSSGHPLTFDWLCKTMGAPFPVPKSVEQLEQIEGAFEIVDLYLYLSYRYPDMFLDVDDVRELRIKLDTIIHMFLHKTDAAGVPLSPLKALKVADEQEIFKDNQLRKSQPEPDQHEMHVEVDRNVTEPILHISHSGTTSYSESLGSHVKNMSVELTPNGYQIDGIDMSFLKGTSVSSKVTEDVIVIDEFARNIEEKSDPVKNTHAQTKKRLKSQMLETVEENKLKQSTQVKTKFKQQPLQINDTVMESRKKMILKKGDGSSVDILVENQREEVVSDKSKAVTDDSELKKMASDFDDWKEEVNAAEIQLIEQETLRKMTKRLLKHQVSNVVELITENHVEKIVSKINAVDVSDISNEGTGSDVVKDLIQKHIVTSKEVVKDPNWDALISIFDENTPMKHSEGSSNEDKCELIQDNIEISIEDNNAESELTDKCMVANVNDLDMNAEVLPSLPDTILYEEQQTGLNSEELTDLLEAYRNKNMDLDEFEKIEVVSNNVNDDSELLASKLLHHNMTTNFAEMFKEAQKLQSERNKINLMQMKKNMV